MTDEIELVAAAIWKSEAVDSGASENLSAGRTPEAFADQSEQIRAKWHKFARTAIEALRPDDDGDMLTIAYLAGAHDAKRDARPSTPQEAAKLLLDRWLTGEFEDTADAAADDALSMTGDSSVITETWLRAIAGEDQT
ncbi:MULTISPECIES: hypothetical protein [unclassified Sulfitobacter]|uniref:hypothetical protein n=1 Tax=unclassified Sulfitobacter TaxID=196795 RepID=UPI0007C3FF0E|nr:MULTISPECIES: hypothetical protein [unclassified Sulfitobacter]KZY25625.1 hypothetical protein A3728_18370 [Sulfitobacter sp. HI0040]KZZ66529.1 hypothetical protein A3764_16820 [Sulfitobacter sp. HI0129]